MTALGDVTTGPSGRISLFRNEEERQRQRLKEEQARLHMQQQQQYHERHHSASESDGSVEKENDHSASQWQKMHSQASHARDYMERKKKIVKIVTL